MYSQGETPGAPLSEHEPQILSFRLPPADVMAPPVPELQVPPRLWQTSQQGELLRLSAHHPQRPRQPLLRREPPLHCGRD